MEYYDNSICRDCFRDSFCEASCSAFLDDCERFNKEHNIVDKTEISKENEDSLDLTCDMNCLSSFLSFNVEDQEWLDVLNGKLTIENMIDYTSLLSYMEEINKTYCESRNLCKKCHSELIEVDDPRGECFGTPVTEKILVCPHCGE